MRSKEELEAALAPVREYFSGKTINDNTVLAAYMRAAGLPAAGAAWSQAKSAVNQGYSFVAAVRLAESDGGEKDPRPSTATASRGRGPENDRLDWFPKQFGPGDLDGLGAQRLLGTPNISPADVLVRETAQNSWDAGLQPVTDFCINLRYLGRSAVAVLRDKVLVGEAPIAGLRSLLRSDSIRVLEISDRGTVGLNGPVRNDRAVEPGVDTNFIDLLFNIGAPRDVHLGGGTYGFGKTIAYTASSVGTVLYWSRCEGELGIEDRLIASALGDGYDSGGKRFTGRHWWGRAIASENRVEPVTGSLANTLGRAIFAKPFKSHETGTSILILDPVIDSHEGESSVQTLADAIVRNLWPKLLRDQTDRRFMRIELQSDGSAHDLPEIESHPQLGGYATCLRAVRDAQSDVQSVIETSWPFPVRVHEVRSQKPNKLLGHIALTRYPTPAAVQASAPSRSVALMRNRAELVVKYLERPGASVDGFLWAGVFKPVESTDDSFADAEPPAHDDWVVESISDPRRKRDVNISLREIKKHSDSFLAPVKNGLDSSGAGVPLGFIGDMLSDLIIQSHEHLDRPSNNSKKRGRGGKRSARPIAVLADVGYEPSTRQSWVRTSLSVEVERASSSGTSVEVGVSVGVDGGSWPDPEMIDLLGWDDANNGTGGFVLGPRRFKQKESAVYVYESRSDLAIDIDLRIVG